MSTTHDISVPPLLLRPLHRADATALHAIFTDAHVRKYLLDDRIVPPAFTHDEIEKSQRSFAANGYGLWGVFLDDKLIGFTGYRPFHQPPELQLLFGLMPAYCGRGYATLLARAMLRYAFETLDFIEVIASTDAPNEASIRVLQKAGMRYWKREQRDSGHDQVYFRMPKMAWR